MNNVIVSYDNYIIHTCIAVDSHILWTCSHTHSKSHICICLKFMLSHVRLCYTGLGFHKFKSASSGRCVTNLGWVRGQDHTNNEQTQSVMV